MREDEKIILRRNEEIKKQYQNIETGIYIGNQFYIFEKNVLFDGRMEMFLPEEFDDMPREMLQKKYPSELRPQIVKTNVSGDINFTFSLLETKVGYEQLSDTVSDYMSVIRRLQPGNLFFDKGTLMTVNTGCAWTEFSSYAINEDLYNMLFLSVIEGKLMLGMFNCPLSQGSDWKSFRNQILGTISDITKEEK